MRPPEPLASQDLLQGFDCGNDGLNRWLQQRALASERRGVSRTVVVCGDQGMDVIAYAALGVCPGCGGHSHGAGGCGSRANP